MSCGPIPEETMASLPTTRRYGVGAAAINVAAHARGGRPRRRPAQRRPGDTFTLRQEGTRTLVAPGPKTRLVWGGERRA
jgi:hypothetical protein